MILSEIPSPHQKQNRQMLPDTKEEFRSQPVSLPTPKDRLFVAIASLIVLLFCAVMMYGATAVLHAGMIGWLAILAMILFAAVTINVLLFLRSSHPKRFNESSRL